MRSLLYLIPVLLKKCENVQNCWTFRDRHGTMEKAYPAEYFYDTANLYYLFRSPRSAALGFSASKKKTLLRQGRWHRSAFADAVFFIRKNKIIQIGKVLLHRTASFLSQYMPETGSNTSVIR